MLHINRDLEIEIACVIDTFQNKEEERRDHHASTITSLDIFHGTSLAVTNSY